MSPPDTLALPALRTAVAVGEHLTGGGFQLDWRSAAFSPESSRSKILPHPHRGQALWDSDRAAILAAFAGWVAGFERRWGIEIAYLQYFDDEPAAFETCAAVAAGPPLPVGWLGRELSRIAIHYAVEVGGASATGRISWDLRLGRPLQGGTLPKVYTGGSFKPFPRATHARSMTLIADWAAAVQVAAAADLPLLAGVRCLGLAGSVFLPLSAHERLDGVLTPSLPPSLR